MHVCNQSYNVINETIDTGIWANNGILLQQVEIYDVDMHMLDFSLYHDNKGESAKLLCYCRSQRRKL